MSDRRKIIMDRSTSSRLRRTNLILEFVHQLKTEPLTCDIESGNRTFAVSEKTLAIHEKLLSRNIDSVECPRDTIFDTMTELYGIPKPIIKKGRKPQATKPDDAPPKFVSTPFDDQVYKLVTVLKGQKFYADLGNPEPIQVPSALHGVVYVPKAIKDLACLLNEEGLNPFHMRKRDILIQAYNHLNPPHPVVDSIRRIEEIVRGDEFLYSSLGKSDFPVIEPDGTIVGFTTEFGSEMFLLLSKIDTKTPNKYSQDQILAFVREAKALRTEGGGAPAKEERPKTSKKEIPFMISIYTLILSCIQLSEALDKLPGYEARHKELEKIADIYRKFCPEWL